MIHWQMTNKQSDLIETKLKKLCGFTYLITNLLNGKKYIGKKHFWSKSKKNGKVESNWKLYTSSSKYVNDDIQQLGIQSFKFQMIEIYTNKRELSKAENDLILASNAVTSDDYYNKNWRGIRAPVLKELKEFFSR